MIQIQQVCRIVVVAILIQISCVCFSAAQEAACGFSDRVKTEEIHTSFPDAHADEVIDDILLYTGLDRNFRFQSGTVANAAAFIFDETRYIIYNQVFLQNLIEGSQTDWSATGVIAHEIGHHLQGHTTVFNRDLPTAILHADELEADKYAGFVLQKMGAPLEEALAGWREFASERGSPSHPPKQYRLNAVTEGWTQSRDAEPAPARSTELWFIAMSRGSTSLRQKYFAVKKFPDDKIRSAWDQGYDITSIGDGDDRWVAVMSKGSSITQQKYKVSESRPNDWIKENWEEGFMITAMAQGRGRWVVVMSRGSGYTHQRIVTLERLSADALAQYWEAGYFVTSVETTRDHIHVVLSKVEIFDHQIIDVYDEIPKDWILKKWQEGYYVTSVAYQAPLWIVLMTMRTDYDDQYYWSDRRIPRDWILEKWVKGYDVTLLY